MRRFPLTLDTDTTEVRDALEIARTQYNRGDLDDAMRWLHRAADIAYEQRHDDRARTLAQSLTALGPPRPPAQRAPEPAPVNRAPSRSVAPPRPSTASTAPRSVAPRLTQATERTPPPSKPPGNGLPRSIVPSRPVPFPQAAVADAVDAFQPLDDDASTSEAIPLMARKVEPFNLDDDATHVGAAPAGLLAALAAERQAPQKAPTPAPAKAPPRAAPAPQPAPPKPVAQPVAPRSSVAPVVTKPVAQPVTRATAPQRPSAQPVAPRPAPQAPAAQAGVIALVDDEDEDQTSPGISPKAVHAMITEAKPRPAVHQALRVALSKGAHGVVARAIGSDGLRAGEVEVMVVGAAAEADVAALFAG